MMVDDERDEADTDADASIPDDALPDAEGDEFEDEESEESDGSGFDEFGNPIEE